MQNYQFQYHYNINPTSSLPPHHFPYQSWPPKLPSVSFYGPPSYLTVTSSNEEEEAALLFVISAVIFSIWGAFLGGASVNSRWLPNRWDWSDPNTSVGILSGAVNGLLLPYGFFYCNATIREQGTVWVAAEGAYLGAAMVNRLWNPTQGKGWNWASPVTYNGAFQGMQTALWLIDATSSIIAFTDEAGLEGPTRKAFIASTYGVGSGIAYHYISQYHDGNYSFLKWDRVNEPGTLFAVVDGIETGTRLPVGFAEIGRDLANRTSNTIFGRDGTFKDVDPWSIFGAGFMSFLYASEENKTFDFTKWDWSSFSTLEAILNGIVYGKDLPEMVMDVKKAFREKKGNSNMDWWSTGSNGFSQNFWRQKMLTRKQGLVWLFDLLL